MEKIDIRKLDLAAVEALRMQTVRLYENGMKKGEIAKVIGTRPTTIGQWIKLHKNEGIKALKLKKRGVPKGAGKRLTIKQELLIRKMITDKTPDQLKFNFALWTREAVRVLVKEQLGIMLPVRTVGDYLKRWGFTPQKPIKRAYERDPKKVENWLQKTYPTIHKRAKTEGAEVQWCDETGVQNNAHYERGYAPVGHTPIVNIPAVKMKINMISTVTNQGKVRFMMYEDKMNADKLIIFMQRLIKDSKKKIFLIMDNLKVHHAIKVTKWLETRKEQIEVFYLPAYSPDLNPDEYLNCDLKLKVRSGLHPKTKDGFKTKIHSHMKLLQKRPERIKKYFSHPSIKYAG